MSQEATWAVARDRAPALKPNERRTMLLLTRMPLASEKVLRRVSGVSHDSSVYACLAGLRKNGLVATLRPSHRETSPNLHYLTDLGLAALAADQEVEVRDLARHLRLRRPDLLALLPHMDLLAGIYELLGYLASAGPGDPELVAFERPWHQRWFAPGMRRPLSLTLPACVAVDWQGARGGFLLLPDVTGVPVRHYRQAFDRLLLLRASRGGELPLLVVGASGEARVARWNALIEDVVAARREAPIPACVATWRRLPEALPQRTFSAELPNVTVRSAPTMRRLEPAGAAEPIPELVGNLKTQEAEESTAAARLGRLTLSVSRAERRVLELVGLHPFLTPDEIGTILNWHHERVQKYSLDLIERGLLRTLDFQEIQGHPNAAGRLELSADGVRLVVAWRQPGVSNAANASVVIGGGPVSADGWRDHLVDQLDHTIGANRVFVELFAVANLEWALGGEGGVEEWQSPAECCRRGLYPDGYGIFRREGKRYGFFLEYDRGAEKPEQYLRKFGAYYDYRDTGRFERDYAGFPAILVVTGGNAAENRVVRAAQAAAVGRASRLRILVTTEWRARREQDGHLGRVWRKPTSGFHERVLWIPAAQEATLRPSHSLAS